MEKLATIGKLDEYLDSCHEEKYSKGDIYTIAFDMPARIGKACLCIFEDGCLIAEVTCFSWQETLHMRRTFHYGSNHQCKKMGWGVITSELIRMIDKPVIAYWH